MMMDDKVDDIFKCFVSEKLRQLGMNGESTVELEKSLQQSALDKMEAKLSNNLHDKMDTKEKHKEKKKKNKKHKKDKKKKKKKEKEKEKKESNKKTLESASSSILSDQKPSIGQSVLTASNSDNCHNQGGKKVILKKKILEEETEVVIEKKEIRGYFDTVTKLKEIERLPLSLEQTTFNSDDSFKQEGPQSMDNPSEVNAFLSIPVPMLPNAVATKKNHHHNSEEKLKLNNHKDSKNKLRGSSVADAKSESLNNEESKRAKKIASNTTEFKSERSKHCENAVGPSETKLTNNSTDHTTVSLTITTDEKSINATDASVVNTHKSPQVSRTDLISNSKVDPCNDPKVPDSSNFLEPGEIPQIKSKQTDSANATDDAADVKKDLNDVKTNSSQWSRSRSRSKKRSKSSRNHRKSRSRSRSRKRSKRPSSRHRSRSRSRKRSKRSHSRHRSRSRSKKRSRRSSSRHRSKSRSPRRHKHHHRHRSGETHRSSRHKSSRRKRSPSPLISVIDKVKLLEIAKANVLAQHKADISVTNLSHESKALLRSGGVTLQQLTGVCQDIAEGKREILAESSNVGAPAASAPNKVHHPFQVKDTPSISINISNRMALMPPPPPKPINELTKEFPVSCGSQHQRKEVLEEVYGKWEPIVKDEETKSEMKAIIEEKVFPDPPPEDNTLTIKEVIAQRVTAARELQSNPCDVNAIKNMFETQQKLDSWTCAKQIPGRFTGSTGLQPLKRSELERGHQPWASNNSFNSGKEVMGIGKSLLQKMGWKEGESLGKTNAGMLEPLKVQVKTDRKGLSSIMEMPASASAPSRKTGGHVVLKDLSGKHPVSALMEICSKRRWKPPDFNLVRHDGPDHNRTFLFKVTVNDASYQPDAPSINKKQAKSQAATAALQAMGLIPS